MTHMDRNIPIDQLHQLLEYDAESGSFRWKVRSRDFFTSDRICNSWNSTYSGKVAGCLDGKGYIKITLFDQGYRAHRVAWALYYNEWPPADMEIDHIDADPLNNRISNLRLVTRSQNECNKRKRRNTKSSFKGVSWNSQKGKWMATAAINGKVRHVGFFATEIEAHECYKQVAAREYGEYARFS